jgi:hypothetical protein
VPALLHSYHAFDFGDLLLQYALNAHLECHLRTGASPAGARESHEDDAFVVHIDQLNIPSVRL